MPRPRLIVKRVFTRLDSIASSTMPMLVIMVTKATVDYWFDGIAVVDGVVRSIMGSIMVKIKQPCLMPSLVAESVKVSNLGQELVVGCVVVRVFVGLSIVGKVVVLL